MGINPVCCYQLRDADSVRDVDPLPFTVLRVEGSFLDL